VHPVLRAGGRRSLHRADRAGALQQVGIYEKEPFESYFSGNTIQICPVGALTSAAYRFRSRPFDLVSDADRVRALRVGLRAAHRPPSRQGDAPARGTDPAVNEEWNCDKGRFAFTYARQVDRITTPLVRDAADGQLRPAPGRRRSRPPPTVCAAPAVPPAC
jgi:NADH-quinone oxidoreductase subunit G